MRSVVKADGAGLMESPKVGIIILALVAIASLIGGLAGWQMRQYAYCPQLLCSPQQVTQGNPFCGLTFVSREKIGETLPWVKPLQYVRRNA